MEPRPPLAEALDLDPQPEGGSYCQTWRSPVEVTLPDGRVRPTGTLIYRRSGMVVDVELEP